MKTLDKFLPLSDYLYIYQLFEYQSTDFLKWYLKNPFKRNFQRKHFLKWTPKALILYTISLVLIFLFSFLIVLFMNLNILFTLFFVLVFEFFSPFFLIAGQLIFYPFEEYARASLIKKAKSKLDSLNNLKTVAIVGSYAKTSIKNMLYTLLWKDFYVVKTPKSYNTQISIARTVLSDLKDNTRIFLVEMDAYHKGDIKALAKLAPPSTAVITAIAPQHLERFGSMTNLAHTQFEIAQSLKKDGILFLNSSDEWSIKIHTEFENINKFFVGSQDRDNTKVANIRQSKENLEFKLVLNKKEADIKLPLIGTHNALNFAIAASIAYHLGLPLEKIKQRAKLILPTEHRMEIRKLGNLTIIDNTYNTNPKAAKSSLKLLGELSGSKKILITPGLIELGSESYKENKNFAKSATEIADEIIIVGTNAKKALMDGLNESDFEKEKIHEVPSTKSALDLLAAISTEQTVVLLENDLPDQYF